MSKQQSNNEPGVNDLVYLLVQGGSAYIEGMIFDTATTAGGELIYIIEACHDKTRYFASRQGFFVSYEEIMQAIRASGKPKIIE